MENSNLFRFATLAQANYFSQVGRLIAENNYKQGEIEIIADRPNENLLCVVIPSSYGQYADIISSAEQAWHINEKRCSNDSIKCVVAIADNVIVGVYELVKEKPNSPSPEEHRLKLNLQLAQLELQQLLLGRRVKMVQCQQVIRYSYLEELDKY